jgi:HD-GYP domain-containing protein (c-di-GMP phosphodiesterase class II)
VADAFSAMTTSRSYRVRLPVAEALRRILDGAGTQFDLTLATAFVDLLERRPGSILRGTDTAERLWMLEGDVDADVA